MQNDTVNGDLFLKLSELKGAIGADLPVSFMVWHGLLTRGENDGFKIPNPIMGDPQQMQGLIGEIYRGSERMRKKLAEIFL